MASRIKVEFDNERGEKLAGLLEMPEGRPGAFALFAHCFTCSKDVAAASRISRALAARGLAVLRFDFTGLGNSDGDFANANFSSNIEDLVQAARYLEAHHQAPSILVGHSLGGAAVLAAAQQLPSVKAVVTIGAPATAQHVERLISGAKTEILARGEAEVTLAGRKFTIKRQFIEDIEQHNDTAHISRLGRALLILHSPVDEIVSIDEAAKIYAAAKHPKSFISLDGADHLLSRCEDSQFAGVMIAEWAGRYLDITAAAPEKSPGTAPRVKSGEVFVSEQNKDFTRRVFTANHQMIADEPVSAGGSDLGPNPYEYLLAALGTCTSMTVRMYANRKQLPLDGIEVTLSHDRIHAEDCRECESETGLVDRIEKRIRLEGDLSEDQRNRLLEIASKCPVHKTLLNEIVINSELIK